MMTVRNDIETILNGTNSIEEAAKEIVEYITAREFHAYVRGCKDTEYDYNQED